MWSLLPSLMTNFISCCHQINGFPMIIQEHSLILFYKSPSLQHNHTDTDPTVVAYSAYHITREVDTSNVSGNK